MFNTKSTLILSSILLAACSQEYQSDPHQKSPQDQSIREMESHGYGSAPYVVALQATLEVDVIELIDPVGKQAQSVALLTDVEEGEWISEVDFNSHLPFAVTEIVDELSSDGEGELNLLPIDIYADRETYEDSLAAIEYALDSGAEFMVISYTEEDHNLIDAIDDILKR